MTDNPSTVPDFQLCGVTWRCFVTEANTYIWRSACGRFAVWREGATIRAQRDGRTGTAGHRDLISAMFAAQAMRRAA